VSEFVGQTNKITIGGQRLNVRPEHITLSRSSAGSDRTLSGTVTDLIFIGAMTRYRFKSSDGVSLISTNPEENFNVGDAVVAHWSKDKEFLVQQG
jgi:ABC-type Fe3+/spermidine/putrescine transport system ATPase subunit